jgi:hypothetical protein
LIVGSTFTADHSSENCTGFSKPGRTTGRQRKEENNAVFTQPDAERQRLKNQRHRVENWRLWGPYLSERAWGTVREDYSADGNVWEYFGHDQSRSRAYRWNEDGLGGICDEAQRL